MVVPLQADRASPTVLSDLSPHGWPVEVLSYQQLRLVGTEMSSCLVSSVENWLLEVLRYHQQGVVTL